METLRQADYMMSEAIKIITLLILLGLPISNLVDDYRIIMRIEEDINKLSVEFVQNRIKHILRRLFGQMVLMYCIIEIISIALISEVYSIASKEVFFSTAGLYIGAIIGLRLVVNVNANSIKPVMEEYEESEKNKKSEIDIKEFHIIEEVKLLGMWSSFDPSAHKKEA